MGLLGKIFGKRSDICCARCKEAIKEGDIKGHNGQVYCSSCYGHILSMEKQNQSGKETEQRTQTVKKTIQVDTTQDYSKAPAAVQQIRDAFNKASIKYRTNHFGDQWEVVAPVSGEQNQYDIKFITKDSGGAVALRVFNLAHIDDNKLENIYALLNKFQSTFRYMRFTLDADQDIKLEYDITGCTSNVGEIAVEMVIRTMKIVDTMYPELMKYIWS